MARHAKPQTGKGPSGNAWLPSKRDLATIKEMAAKGVTQNAIAAQFKINPKTLRSRARGALDEGMAANESALVGRIMSLAAQDEDRKVALASAKFLLGAVHGVRETLNLRAIIDETDAEADTNQVNDETEAWWDEKIRQFEAAHPTGRVIEHARYADPENATEPE